LVTDRGATMPRGDLLDRQSDLPPAEGPSIEVLNEQREERL
jgi:hypothetical protein